MKREVVPDIYQYFIFSTLSIALMVATFVALYVFVWKKEKSTEPVIEKIKVKSSQTNCHESAFRLLPEVILILNSEYKITYMNPAAEKMLGYKLRSVMGRNYRSVISLKNLKTNRVLQDISNENIANPDSSSGVQEYELQTQNNQNFPIKLSLIPMSVKNHKGKEESYLLLVLKNVAEMKALESKLSNYETYDGLTRILNRKSFDSEVKQLIDNTHKHNSIHILAYLSIDQFQVINDTIGHAGSDKLIENITDIIKSNISESIDIIGKVGVSEFGIVFCERRLASGVQAIQKIIKDVDDNKFMSRGKEYPASLSAGFVVINNESTSSTRVLSEANRACNLANKRGGNRLCAYRTEDEGVQKLEDNLEWVMILKKAIQENRFEMYAQPIQPLAPIEYSKPFSHYELLIRLNDEEGNPISPMEFISAAEYYSMMPALDRWVIQNTFEQISKVPKQQPLPVFAINLSGQSLNDSVFLDFVLAELKSSGVDPDMLCFEITEQVAVDDITHVTKFISSLKALGSSFSLDDFGTGVSSFGYLRSLDVDYLKIDGSFVKNIATDEVAKGMVQSITQIGHTMNLKIIAEYVENAEIMAILGDMGVEYGQGYHISRPGPLSTVIRQHQSTKNSEEILL